MPFCRKISEYNSLSPFTQIFFFFLHAICLPLLLPTSGLAASVLYAKQFSRWCLFIPLL